MLSMEHAARSAAKLARAAEPYCAFLVRTSLGVTFASAGYGKLMHLERTTSFFRELGIPAPEIQAAFIGGLEFLGGLCIVLGLMTRVVSIPLGMTMIVAILTALLPDVAGVLDLVTRGETLYLFLFGWLAAAGAGRVSLDHWFTRKIPLFSRLAIVDATHEPSTPAVRVG